MILALVDEAVVAGARLRAACEIIGLSVRAVERWRMRPEGDDRRCGPLHAPGNALSESEKAQVLAVMTTSGLSPKQSPQKGGGRRGKKARIPQTVRES